MRTLRQLYLLLLLSAVSMTAQPRTILPDHLDARDEQSAIATLAGAGIDIGDVPSRAYAAATGGDVIWKMIYESTVPAGTRHVLHQQHLRRADGTDVPLAGAYVVVHYKDGQFDSVDGQQFTRVRVENDVRLSPNEARRIAQQQENAPTELVLVATNEGAFRYAYSVTGRHRGTLIDAADRSVLRTADVRMNSNCASSGQQSWPAIGVPVNPDLAATGLRRSLYASYVQDRTWQGFTYEGHWAGNPYANMPNVNVFHSTGDSTFMCGLQRWTLFPVPLIFNPYNRSYDRIYQDDGSWSGSAAGDALYKTRQAMEAFSTLGRRGYDGNLGDANIMVGLSDSPDVGTFVKASDAQNDARLPDSDVVVVGIVGNPLQRYNVAASLDLIAHEWGHGVILHSTARFDPMNNPIGQQLGEGFADVIGQTAEKLREPSGTGTEQNSDWKIGEDASRISEYLRSGNIDDGDGANHMYFGALQNNMLHRSDQPGYSSTPNHDRGNMLNVVLYLLSEGGTNPVCNRPGVNNCHISVPAIPFYAAAQILFDVVQSYANPGTQWENLADLAIHAAYNRYSLCGVRGNYDAMEYQTAVNQAFSAIGYPRTLPFRTCP